jgi:hypothetical protein
VIAPRRPPRTTPQDRRIGLTAQFGEVVAESQRQMEEASRRYYRGEVSFAEHMATLTELRIWCQHDLALLRMGTEGK